jgi:hypothetical protein
MPCFTIQRTRIELGPKTNADHLHAGLVALGLNPSRYAQGINFTGGKYDNRTGQLTLTGSNAEERGNEIRRSYMTEATKATAKRFGFQVKTTGKNKFDVIKATL